MPLYVHNGSLLRNAGALASSQSCCCNQAKPPTPKADCRCIFGTSSLNKMVATFQGKQLVLDSSNPILIEESTAENDDEWRASFTSNKWILDYRRLAANRLSSSRKVVEIDCTEPSTFFFARFITQCTENNSVTTTFELGGFLCYEASFSCQPFRVNGQEIPLGQPVNIATTGVTQIGPIVCATTRASISLAEAC